MASRNAVTKWLLDSDPAIQWQVMRDLTDEPPEAVAAERARVALEGWGGQLLAMQSPDGHWNDDQRHGWMTTNDALALLRELGADPSAEPVREAVGRVCEHVKWYQLEGQPFFDGETEACINGRILSAGAYFGTPVDRLLRQLLSEQLEDGGWNCEAPKSKRSSFHSTICVLEGLLEYETAHGATPAVTQARMKGQDYLLERGMLRSLTSGEVVNDRWTRFSFPTVWSYDVLRGLDYLRSAGVKPDTRVAEAIGIVEERRHQNGRWPMNHLNPDHDRIPLDIEPDIGSASRWNTLRALRVLDWYGAGCPAS